MHVTVRNMEEREKWQQQTGPEPANCISIVDPLATQAMAPASTHQSIPSYRGGGGGGACLGWLKGGRGGGHMHYIPQRGFACNILKLDYLTTRHIG